MPLYKYTALNEKGRTLRGVITAANELDLEHRLHGIGLDLITCKESKGEKFSAFGRVSTKDVILLCVHLEQLERAGVPILDALSDLRDTTDSPRLKTIMVEIFESVKSGNLLSVALAEHPSVFDSVFTGIVQAGEKTGNLADSFAHLSKHLKWVDDLRRRIKKASIFPIIMVFVLAGVITAMMLLVVPQLVKFLEAQNIDLPLQTRALIAASYFFQAYYHMIFAVPLSIFFLMAIMRKISEDFAYTYDSWKLHIPVLGPTFRKIELARFCHFFAITFRSGLGILECLEVAQNGVKNLVIKESVIAVRKAVSEGSSLTAALQLSNQFPSLVVRMFKVGEDSGGFDEVLENITFFFDKEVGESVDSMIGLIQPLLTVILGGIMAWIIAAIFGPLYSNFSSMNF